MVNTLIAAFVAIFFWGKTSKETEEKTRRASKLRAFVYLVLSLVVGFFFYKTYQVSTIYNSIQVNAFRPSYDSAGNIVDTIHKIEIFNRFTSANGYKNDIYRYSLRENKKINEFAEVGGIRLSIYGNNKKIYQKKNNPELPADILEYIGVPISNPDHVYGVGFITTSIPRFLPLYPKVKEKYDWKYYGEGLYMKMRFEDLKDNDNFYITTDENSKYYEESEDKRNLMVDGIGFQEYFVTKDLGGDEPYIILTAYLKSDLTNTFNILTAADISQYSFMIGINSDCPVDKLTVDYDLPIEMTYSDSCLFVGSHGFDVTGEMLESMSQNRTMIFHVKLPTMANIQLIRSLFLTTLLTALISLFLRNLYFLIRKWAIGYKKRNRLPYSKAKLISQTRVKWFRRIMYCITILFMLLVLWLSYRMFIDSPISVSNKSFFYIIYCVFGALIALIIFIYLLYRYMRKPYVKKESDENSEDYQTIFVHERDEDSEYDQLVEEMYKENPEDISDEGINDNDN